MLTRSTGWIQDPGKLENLIKVVELFDYNTLTHKNLIKERIPRLVKIEDGREQLLKDLNNRTGFNGYPLILYKSLVGTAFYPRSNARCNGIVQALIPGQRRDFISDWPANNFIRWAETLGFIQYHKDNDSYTITEFGLNLTQKNNDILKFDIIKDAFLKYPPIIRILELLKNRFDVNPAEPMLTKFELGSEIGFRGEDGFTSFNQNIVVQALSIANNNKERNKIRTDWEGSCDKYARMICNWLSHPDINWVEKNTKSITVNIAGNNFTADIAQSYKITPDGLLAYKKTRAKSKHKYIPKRVIFTMLATRGSDRNYLRNRRALMIKYLCQWRTPEQVKIYMEKNGFYNLPTKVILNEIKNFTRIGLNLKRNQQNKYRIIDEIIDLHIPEMQTSQLLPSSITKIKLKLANSIKMLDLEFLDLIDLSFIGKQSRTFELRIIELLNLIADFNAIHLSGGNRPEIIAYSPAYKPEFGVIIDSKAYEKGFNIPHNERDKMIRYIEEYKQKDNKLNKNRWWENFKSPTYPNNPIRYTFISGKFIGNFSKQLIYIFNRTNTLGAALTSSKLIEKVDKLLNPDELYSIPDFFKDLSCNNLVG